MFVFVAWFSDVNATRVKTKACKKLGEEREYANYCQVVALKSLGMLH